MADRVGQQLGNYQLTRLLGRGGFAEVYLGQHIHLNTQAAIKVLSAKLSQYEIEQFRAEARTIAALKHPNIVRVLDFGVEDDTPFLVMEYAPNGSLRQRYPPGTRLPLATIIPYVKQVAAALQYAHDTRLIHRDIKPENMLLGSQNEILLSDFGIATEAQSSHQQQTGHFAGTAAYSAPEQLQGRPRPASDQYALGIVVYEWLSGERPFRGSALEIASQHVLTPPPSLRERVPTLSSTVEEVVMTALAKDPHQRFASVAAFANALERASSPAQPSVVAPTPKFSPPPTTPNAPPAAAASTPKFSPPPTTPNAPPPAPPASPYAGTPPAAGMGGNWASPPAASVYQAPAPAAPPTFTYSKPQPAPASPQAQPLPAPSYPPGYYDGPPPSKKGRSGLIAAIVIVVLVVIIGGATTAFILNGQKPNTGANNSSATPTPTATATPGTPAGFTQFTGTTFSIEYPSDWTKQADSQGNGGEDFTGPSGQIFEVTITSNATSGQETTFNTAFCSVVSSGTPTSATVVIRGEVWQQLDCGDSGNLHAVVESVVYKGNLYSLAYASASTTFANDKTQYFSVMEHSFNFLT